MKKETKELYQSYAKWIGIVLIALFIFEPFSSDEENVHQRPTIQTSGSCETEITSDTALLVFTIKNESKKLQNAVKKTQESYQKLIGELTAAGFDESELSTIGYDVAEEKYWDSEKRRSIRENYYAKMTVQLKTTSIEKVELAMQQSSKFNDVLAGKFSTSLSDDAYKKAYENCLEQAAKNARDKAEKIAKGSGRRLGKPVSLRETENQIYPRDHMIGGRAMMAKMEMMDSAPQIMKSNTKINVEIQASFEVK